jgi:hypothetical protein
VLGGVDRGIWGNGSSRAFHHQSQSLESQRIRDEPAADIGHEDLYHIVKGAEVTNAPAITRPTSTDIDMCIYTLSFEQYEPFGRSCCCFTLSDSENNLISVILFTVNENSTITQRRFQNAPSASKCGDFQLISKHWSESKIEGSVHQAAANLTAAEHSITKKFRPVSTQN